MSERNWKTTQRKTTRNVLQNFASRPISTLSSIKEASVNSISSNNSHSNQSSESSTMDKVSKQENHVIQKEGSDLASTPNNDIYQIIEEECNNGEQQGDITDIRSPPKEAFQQNDDDIQEFIDFDQEIENHNIEEKASDINEEFDEDDNAPIIYAHHDDDSISQITSSVAGYSMYSSDHILSKQLSRDDNNKKYTTMNHGGVSHMRPNLLYGNSFGSQNATTLKKRNDSNVEEKSPLMEDEELNKFFGPSDGEHQKDVYDDLNNVEEKGDDLIDVDIYTNNERKKFSSDSQYHHGSNVDDDLTLRDMYSIGPSLSNESRRTFSNESQNEFSFASVLQKTRLRAQAALIKAKHVINKYNPFDDSSNIEQKKNDDLDQYSTASTSDETDYFGMLMSSSFVSTSSNASLYRFRNRKENQINFLWISSLLILIWLLLYLAKIGNDSAWEKRQMQRLGNKLPKPIRSGLRAAEKSPLAAFDRQNGNENINVAEVEIFHPGKTLPTYSEATPQKPGEAVKKDTTITMKNPVVPAVPQEANVVAKPVAKTAPVQVDTSHIGMPLPEHFNNFLDVTETSVPQVPFFWHIPRTAGATINEILSVCYHLNLAANAPVQGHEQDASLQLLNVGAGHSYLNVDVSSSQGIQRAVSMNLVPSGLSDVVVSSLVNEVGPLFDPNHKARAFTMIRHPVMRAASLFHFLQDIRWRAKETFNEELANISINDYFKKRMGESNWQVRYLTNQVTKPYIDESDLKLAKEILRRKFFVGLTSEREESFARFEKIFGWKPKNQADVECLGNRLQWDWALKHPHQIVEEGTELWNMISEHNRYDVELFNYAKVLFQEQAALLK